MRIWLKRGLLLCSLAALCAMLSLATLAVGYIGEDGAVGAVLRHTGGRRQDLEALFVALHDNGRQPPVYEVRYRQGGYQVYYTLDAKTGEILHYGGHRVGDGIPMPEDGQAPEG